MNVVVQCNALTLPPSAAADADVMIVDPPYSPNVHRKATSAGTGGRGVRKRDLTFDSLSPALMLRIAEFAAQVRRWTVVFCDVESAHVWRAALCLTGCEYVRSLQVLPWVRWSQPQLSGDRPPTGCEMVVIAHAPRANLRGAPIAYPRPYGSGAEPSRKMHWNGPGSRVAYAAKSLRGDDKYSCEKPLDLMLAIVSDFSDPGEVVLDPCAGMGTTCVAAALLGRQSVGLERKAAVARDANKRSDWAHVPSKRDAERAARWLEETRAEATSVPTPKVADGSDVKTWERAQRRLADVARVERALKGE